MDPVESIEQDVAQIEEIYETEKAKLMTPRGEPYNMPETHTRLMADVEARRWSLMESALDRHEEQATRKAEATRKELAPLVGDPITRLPDGVLQRAQALASFIREDCEALDPYTLRNRIDFARLSGDPAQGALYARYGAQRVEREEQQAREAGRAVDRDVSELQAAVASLTDEATRAKISKLEQELNRATAAQNHVRMLREYKRPGGKQELADALGVDPRYFNV